MIDKYLLEDLSLRSDEKGELARWVIQLQADVDTERRKSASLESVIYARDTRIAGLEARLEESRETTLLVRDEWQKDKARADEAEKRLDTPVRLPKPCAFNLCDLVDRDAVIASLREQGFTVEGDE